MKQVLNDKGIHYLPDFITTQAEVICTASKHQKATRSTAFSSIEEKVRSNTEQTLVDLFFRTGIYITSELFFRF